MNPPISTEMKPVFHPDIDDIEAASVFAALADPTRLAIVLAMAEAEEFESRCSSFTDFGSPSLLTYHFNKLREAGVTRVRAAGTSRYVSLRRDDLDARFPGLLDSIIATARRDTSLPRIPEGKLIAL